MNIFDVVVPVVLFLVGLRLLQEVPGLQEDPLRQINERTAGTLQSLVQTKFFRIIRLNINQECSLGMMKKLCKNKSCTVCRCNDRDIPESWLNT